MFNRNPQDREQSSSRRNPSRTSTNDAETEQVRQIFGTEEQVNPEPPSRPYTIGFPRGSILRYENNQLEALSDANSCSDDCQAEVRRPLLRELLGPVSNVIADRSNDFDRNFSRIVKKGKIPDWTNRGVDETEKPDTVLTETSFSHTLKKPNAQNNVTEDIVDTRNNVIEETVDKNIRPSDNSDQLDSRVIVQKRKAEEIDSAQKFLKTSTTSKASQPSDDETGMNQEVRNISYFLPYHYLLLLLFRLFMI
jgi:hypothetical protein